MSTVPQKVQAAVAVLPDLEAKRARAEWPFDVGLIPLVDCIIDDTYQRPPAHEFVATLASNFDDTLVGTIDVSKRAGGVYAILDGQQRYFAMQQVGKTACYAAIYSGMTIADEAGFFYRKNKDRKAMKPYYSFRARMVAGDTEAAQIQSAVEEEGFVLGVASNDHEVIGAIRAIERAYNLSSDHREECLTPALATIREAFYGRRGSFDSWILQGLARFWQTYTDDEVDGERLAEALKPLGPQGLLGQARDALIGVPRTTTGGRSVPWAVARVAAATYNKQLQDRRQRLDQRRLI